MYFPSRADIIYAELSPHKGREQGKHRPVLVLSDISYHRKMELTTICAITTKPKGFPYEVIIPDGLDVYGCVLTDQIRTISLCKERNIYFKCKAPWELFEEVLEKISTHIGLS